MKQINKEYKEYADQDNKPVLTEIIKLPKNQQIVYDTILNNPGVRIPALSSICGMKETSVDNAIRQLKKNDLIEYKGTSKDGGYYAI